LFQQLVLNLRSIAMPLLFWMPFVMFTAMCEVIAEEINRLAAPSTVPVKAITKPPARQ
jgi:hypothetical protein